MDEHVARARRIAQERGWDAEEIPPEPDPPPDGMLYLWEWYVELAGGRTSSGFGPSALSWPDIAAWAALTGQHPDPWEVSILRRLDSVYLGVTIAANAKGRPNSDRPSNLRVRDRNR